MDDGIFLAYNYLPYIKTHNGKITDVSQAFLDLTEYSKEDIIEKYIGEIVDLIRLNIDVNVLESQQDDKSFFLFTKSFAVREISLIVKHGFSPVEKVYLFLEKPNSRLEDKFPYVEQLYKHNIMGIAIYEATNFVLLKANQTYLNFLNEPYHKKENSIGKSLYEICTCWTDSDSYAILNNIVDTGEPYINKERALEGLSKGLTYWDVSIIPLLEKGKVKYLVEAATEVTQAVLNRKHVEKQMEIIKQQKDQLEAIIENMSEGVFITDKEGNYTLLNSVARDMVHQPSSLSALGYSCKTIKYLDEEGNEIPLAKMPSSCALRGEKVKSQRILMRLPDKEIAVSANATPVYDEKGHLTMTIACFHDITDLVQYGKEKIQILEKAIVMKDEFFSLISHEFKTPLTVINSAIQAMELICKKELSEKAKGFIDKIKQNSFRQLRLVNNLLDITRINASHIKINKRNLDIVFLTKAITKSVRLYAQQKSVKLTFTSTFGHKIIGIDDEKYERILLNLLSNAIKFTPEGNSVTVKVCSQKGNICIEVKDEGLGIPEDKRELIFERFGQVDSSLTRQAEGTGIGLSLVKLFVEALGGTIALKSKIGKGSTFTILLPATEAQENQAEQTLLELTDNRLIQATQIEFSDIYLS